MAKNLIELLVSGKDVSAAALKSATKNMDEMGASMQKIGGIAIGMGVAIGAAMFAIASKTAAAGDQLAKFERMTGVSAETMAVLEFSAKRWGASASEVQMAVRKLSKAMVDANDGLATYTRIFDRMGVSINDSQGKLKEFTTILPEIMDWFAKTEDATLKMATAQDMFGRSGAKLIPLLESGQAGLAEMTKRAKDLGIVFGKEAAGAAEEYADAMLDIKQSILGIVFTMGKELMPTITATTNTITEHIIQVRKWIELHPELTKGILAVSVALVGAGGLSVALGTILRLIHAVRAGSVLAFGPGGLIVTAIAAGVIVGFIEIRKNMKLVRDEMERLRVEGERLKSIAEFPEHLRSKYKMLSDEIEKLKRTLKGTEVEVITGFTVDTTGSPTSLIPQIETMGRDDAIKYYEAQMDELRKLAGQPIEIKTKVSFDPVEVDIESIEFTDSVEEMLGPFRGEMNRVVHDIVVGAIEQPELRASATSAMDYLFGPMMTNIGFNINNTIGIVSAGFNNMFQKMVRDGRKATDLLKGFFQSMASSIASMLANLAAKMAIALAISAFTGMHPIPIFSSLQGGGTVVHAQGGGTVVHAQGGGTATSGVRGVDSLPAMIGKGETVLTHDLTDRLDAFIESGWGGNAVHIHMHSQVITATNQEATRFGRMSARAVEDYQNSFQVKGSV